jgi:transposase-like protein
MGMWISPNEGSKFWLSVLTEIHNRGVKDILIACVDGLTGFPNAIETVFPKVMHCPHGQKLSRFCALAAPQTSLR